MRHECDARYHRICLQALASLGIPVANAIDRNRTTKGGITHYHSNLVPCGCGHIGEISPFQGPATGAFIDWRVRLGLGTVLAGGFLSLYIAGRLIRRYQLQDYSFYIGAASWFGGSLGSFALTAFGPTGRAFQGTVEALFHSYHGTERVHDMIQIRR